MILNSTNLSLLNSMNNGNGDFEANGMQMQESNQEKLNRGDKLPQMQHAPSGPVPMQFSQSSSYPGNTNGANRGWHPNQMLDEQNGQMEMNQDRNQQFLGESSFPDSSSMAYSESGRGMFGKRTYDSMQGIPGHRDDFTSKSDSHGMQFMNRGTISMMLPPNNISVAPFQQTVSLQNLNQMQMPQNGSQFYSQIPQQNIRGPYRTTMHQAVSRCDVSSISKSDSSMLTASTGVKTSDGPLPNGMSSNRFYQTPSYTVPNPYNAKSSENGNSNLQGSQNNNTRNAPVSVSASTAGTSSSSTNASGGSSSKATMVTSNATPDGGNSDQHSEKMMKAEPMVDARSMPGFSQQQPQQPMRTQMGQMQHPSFQTNQNFVTQVPYIQSSAYDAHSGMPMQPANQIIRVHGGANGFVLGGGSHFTQIGGNDYVLVPASQIAFQDPTIFAGNNQIMPNNSYAGSMMKEQVPMMNTASSQFLVSSTHQKQMKLQASLAKREKRMKSVVKEEDYVLQHFNTRKIMTLETSTDSIWLSPFLCFLRKECCEVFTAAEKDVLERRKSKQVRPGQVGIRCKFCAHLPHSNRVGRSSCFPSSVDRIYQSVTMMIREHFPICPEFPDETRRRYVVLKTDTKKGEMESKRHWVRSAESIGMKNTEVGIFLEGNKKAPIEKIEEGDENEASSDDSKEEV